MKFSVLTLAVLNCVEARSAWSIIKGTKDQQRKPMMMNSSKKEVPDPKYDGNTLQVSYYTELAKRNATATEEQTMLRGTLALTFKDDLSVPQDGNAVRICMALRNPVKGVSNTWAPTEWESIGFQLTNWFVKDGWITRFNSEKNTQPDSWCAKSMDTDQFSTKNYDSQWETTAQYWNANKRQLLVDFQRPMDVAGLKTINLNMFTDDTNKEEGTQDVDFMLNYGVYKDSKTTSKTGVQSSDPLTYKEIEDEKSKTTPKKTKKVAYLTGPMGDSKSAAIGKDKTAKNYKPEGFQFLGLLEGANWIAASSAIVVTLAANSLY